MAIDSCVTFNDVINAKHTRNCEELRTRFEGKEAIYVEKGALRVRVRNFRPRGGFHIRAEAEEIVTPGLGVGMFHRPRPPGAGPRRWTVRAGYLTTFSAQSWHLGYGGGAFYFAPEIVRAVVGFAARLPGNADPDESYTELGCLLRDSWAHEPEQFVFPDAVEQGSGKFRKSGLSPMDVQASSGWIVCPCCAMRFTVFDPRRWDGEQHTTCGQRLIIKDG